jgi:hypothetical protein
VNKTPRDSCTKSISNTIYTLFYITSLYLYGFSFTRYIYYVLLFYSQSFATPHQFNSFGIRHLPRIDKGSLVRTAGSRRDNTIVRRLQASNNPSWTLARGRPRHMRRPPEETFRFRIPIPSLARSSRSRRGVQRFHSGTPSIENKKKE